MLSDHGHEFGHTALPYLRAHRIRYKMNINLPDEKAEGVHEDWQPAPYGSMSYAFDVQPMSGMTRRHQVRYASCDHIACYAESRVNTSLESVSVERDGQVVRALAGTATVSLELCCFRDREDGVEHDFRAVKAFSCRSTGLLSDKV